MTRLDTDDTVAREAPADCDGPRALVFDSREVPLGGVRGMQVRRALPQRELPLVGAWCFLDRFGPQVTTMRVEPHPHIGLQTVTWPLVGEVRHRDCLGSDVIVRRGALNLMTSGAGISHSEYSIADPEGTDPEDPSTDTPLDALQLWVALPESRRHGAAAFEQHTDLPVVALEAVQGDPGEATVVLGTLAGATSPATVHTPIVGAEVRIPAGATVRIPLNPDWEHALAGVTGELTLAGARIDPATMVYLGLGREEIEVSSETDATAFLLGGEPFEDDIVMWWNFVGRSHDEIVNAREEWEAASDRFGTVPGHGDVRIPAPPMPGVRLTQRRRRL